VKFSIILVVYDPMDTFSCAAALPSTVGSLSSLDGLYELIIVNNHDPAQCPQTSAFLRSLARQRADTKLVELAKNIGCGAGFNRGVSEAAPDSEAFVYLSCDAYILDALSLSRCEEIFATYPLISALHPVSIYEDMDEANYSREWNVAQFHRVMSNWSAGVSCCGSAAVRKDIIAISAEVLTRPLSLKRPVMMLPLTFYVVRRDVFERLGGFNEGFIAGWENIDFCLRALALGYQSAIVNNAFVYHRRDLFHALGQHRAWGQDGAQGRPVGRHPGELLFSAIWHDEPVNVYYRLRFGQIVGWLLKSVRRILKVLRRIVKAVKASPLGWRRRGSAR
jgi:N-acetylglucosaminyl-diphospho-decaprenol L-rhamnosyltransferase